MSNNLAKTFSRNARQKPSISVEEWPLPEQLIGLEIEVEAVAGTVLPRGEDSVLWKKERDGSLRNGVEYVLAIPLSGNTLAQAITTIFQNGTFLRSVTGSTHIHLDMMEEDTTTETVKYLVLLCYILEPVLFAVGDKGREWCGYTNKLSTAPDYLLGAVLNTGLEEGYSELTRLCADAHGLGRYYGLNLLALAKYGSVEFRYFPTATSAEELSGWVKLVQSFKKAALSVSSMEALCDLFQEEGKYVQFITTYFKPWVTTILNEVPFWAAEQAMHKALATGASHKASVNLQEEVAFNPNAITKNKALRKFIKKSVSKKIVDPYSIVGLMRPYPDGLEAEPLPRSITGLSPPSQETSSLYGIITLAEQQARARLAVAQQSQAQYTVATSTSQRMAADEAFLQALSGPPRLTTRP